MVNPVEVEAKLSNEPEVKVLDDPVVKFNPVPVLSDAVLKTNPAVVPVPVETDELNVEEAAVKD